MLKRKPYRNKKILEAAKGEECLIQSPYCNYDPNTVVAAHSNECDDGKGAGQKADDCFIAFACSSCHDYVDGRAPKYEGESDFEIRLFYHNRGIKRTIRRLLDMGVLK